MPQITTLFWIAFTVAVYRVVRHLYIKYNNPLFNTVLLSSLLIIGALVLFGLPFEAYVPAKDSINFLMGPATVCLALPLYRYRCLLRVNAVGIMSSVAAGAFVTMLSAGLIAKLGGLPREVVMSVLPKGISIPFAVELAEMYGGIPALSAAFVVAAGTLGSLGGAWTLTIFGITLPFARGLGLGTAAHGQGTAIALEEGEEQGAMAGLAMILAGLFTAAFMPLAVYLLDAVMR